MSDEASFSEAMIMEGAAAGVATATVLAEILRSNAGLQPTLRLCFIGEAEQDTIAAWSSYGLRLLFRGRIVGVYMASLTRLVLLGAGLLAPTPEAAAPPPPPAARSSESLGEEDGRESFLLFFNVFIFVMVFSIVLVASVCWCKH